ncbi:MAG: hypothetical protein ACRDLP_14130, partial [Solirubrobacteraceae bacterium]
MTARVRGTARGPGLVVGVVGVAARVRGTGRGTRLGAAAVEGRSGVVVATAVLPDGMGAGLFGRLASASAQAPDAPPTTSVARSASGRVPGMRRVRP